MKLEPFVNAPETHRLEGVVVYQKGRGTAAHRCVAEQRVNIRSVSKSFASVAIGMAVDEGKLSLSDRVSRAFDMKSPDARWSALTLEHLLTMTLGHTSLSRPKSVEEALALELSRDPGTVFVYDNACTFLASAMLTRATGLTLRDYLLDRLFRPLGISGPEWMESDDGYTIGATGLFLTTSEMALFGRFLLQRGEWEGRQLVSAAWIDRATRAHVATRGDKDSSDYSLGYGYHFWICPHGAYRAEGKDGQFIIVFPGLDAVVAINAAGEDTTPILRAVWEHIWTSLKTSVFRDEPL